MKLKVVSASINHRPSDLLKKGNAISLYNDGYNKIRLCKGDMVLVLRHPQIEFHMDDLVTEMEITAMVREDTIKDSNFYVPIKVMLE